MQIAVIGDTHLGMKQYGLNDRQEDFKSSFKDAVSKIDNSIPIILVGDLFNMPRPVAELVYFTKQELKNHRVYDVVGNHDLNGEDWLKLCNIQPLANTINKIIRLKVRPLYIAGLNWIRPANFMTELDSFLTTIKEPVDIFVIHQLLDDFIPYAQNQISGKQIADRLSKFGVKIVVMGDLHQAVDMNINGIQFIYTGSTEVNSISEKYDKSFVMLDISDDENPQITFKRIPIKTRPFIHKFIQTKEDIEQLALLGVYEIAPFFILEYDNENKELVKIAESVLTGKHLYRLIPIVKGSKSNLFTQLSMEGMKRNSAMEHLRNSIASFFDPNTDEYQLIIQLLELPEEVPALVTAYAKNKGI